RHSAPSLCVEMALPLFSKSLLYDLGLQAFFGIHFLKSSVFVLKLLHASHHGGVHAAVFGAPLVKRSAAHAVLAAQIWHRRTSFSLLEDRHNLAVGVSRLFH